MKKAIIYILLFSAFSCTQKKPLKIPEKIQRDIGMVDSLSRQYIRLVKDTSKVVEKLDHAVLNTLIGVDTPSILQIFYTSFPDTPLVRSELMSVSKAGQYLQEATLFTSSEIKKKLIGGEGIDMPEGYYFSYDVFQNAAENKSQPGFFLKSYLIKTRNKPNDKSGFTVILFYKYYR